MRLGYKFLKNLSGAAPMRRLMQVSAASLIALTTTLPNAAQAVSFDIFLIADHEAPTSNGASPFSVTTKKAYRLFDLNGNNFARQAEVVDNFTFNINGPMTFNNDNYNNGVNEDASQLTDMGETGQGTAALVNSELGTWENSGITNPNTRVNDPAEQVDFGRNAPIIMNPVAGGFTDLVIAELGGLNPFGLGLCDDADCTTLTRLLSGLNTGLRNTLAANPDFNVVDDVSDTGNGGVDQLWLFRFADPVTDFVRILEDDDRNFYTNNRLKADYVGTGSGSSASPVPLPTSLPLLAGGLGLMGWNLRRRKG